MKRIAGTTTNEPVTLSAFYLNILNTLPNTERGQRRTKKLFQWLITARTPLTLEELRDAFTLKIDQTPEAGIRSSMGMGAFKKTLRDSCGALIKITNTVSLYHQSGREFFLQPNHKFSIKQNEAELHSATACLTYLSFSGLTNAFPSARTARKRYSDDSQLLCDYPLLKYAALYWPRHIAKVQDNVCLWKLFVSWANSNNVNVCCRIYWYFKGTGHLPMDITPLHFVCYLGLESLVGIGLLVDGPKTWITMVNTSDSLRRTPLHWAAVNGHNRIVQLLLQSGANAEQMDSTSLTPLELALEFGNSEVVLTLIMERRIQSQWLELAVIGGHLAVVQLLLNRQADANAVSSATNYGSALHAAAYRGNEEIVVLLLNASANVNQFSDKFGTPLQVASFQGNMGVVKLLLGHDADPNSPAGIHGTALQAAAQQGYFEIVKELIDHKADVRAPAGQTTGTALYLAEHAGYGDIVEILVGSGALSEAPVVVRRQSVLDPVITHRLELTAHGISRADQPVVRRQVEFYRARMNAAIDSKNELSVRVLLAFSAPYFALAVRFGHENSVESLVDVALVLAQNAAKIHHPEILRLVSVSWTNALLNAITDGKASLVERALQKCINNLQILIDNGKISDAKDLITAGLEIYMETCRLENRELIEIVAKVWAMAAKDLIKGPFRDNLFKIVDIYAERWITAVIAKDGKEVRVMGKAGVEVLLAAAGTGGSMGVSMEITAYFLVKLRRVLHDGDPNMRNWLLNEADPISKVAIRREDEELAEALVRVGMEFFLAIRHPHPNNDHDQLQQILLEITTPVLEDIERAGLMDSAKTSIESLAVAKFEIFHSGDSRKDELDQLERNLLEVLDAVTQAATQISSIPAIVADLKMEIRLCASDARLNCA